ncbi:MAG: hypothetical protein HQ485_04205 [Acidobacteria bacterium]|nr:hypothetical protein [Acidobacteriota bacterium]
MRRFIVGSILAGAAVFWATGISPQGAQNPAGMNADGLLKAWDTYESMRESSPFRTSTWQYLGPTNVSGRATDVAVADVAGIRHLYVAYATSGVWKSEDEGKTWRAIFEHEASTSIGDVEVAPSNSNIVWVGTGEANIFRASMAGVGVYKSTDAGKTFTHMGLADTQTISRILVHPTNPEIVYVAASGHEWTDNEMRGVFKTTNGGSTWTKVLYKSPRTGAIDLVMDPTDPNVLYAAMWQRIRRKYSDPRVEPGYDEGGIMKSTDGGRTWADASQGLPTPQFRGRIGIDIARSNPSVLYAFVDNYEEGRGPQEGERDAYGRAITNGRIKAAEVYRTSDKGATWTQVSENNDYMIGHSGTYGWVFGQIRVDPTDENTIYTMGLALNKSVDGGKTYARMRGTSVSNVTGESTGGVHGDHHGLFIDPKDPKKLYNTNDGGFYHSLDGGETWVFAIGAAGAHFYNVELDTSRPSAWIYGSIQDHGSRRAQLDLTAGRDKIKIQAWENAPGGEGSNHAIDPTNPNIVYSHGFYGNFSRTDLSIPQAARGRGARGGQATPPTGPQRETDIEPPPPPNADLRAQWMAPIIISPHDNTLIYAGYQQVFKSDSRGDGWEILSPDLTKNDPNEMLIKNSNAIPYQTIVALAESPKKAGLMYVGSDDGRLHTTIDSGKEWTELTSKIPVRRWFSRLLPSAHAEGTVYVAQRGREDDDFAAYLYKSIDYGKTFTNIVNNIPAGPVNVIREHPTNPNILFVGTDFGAYVSTNGGAKWEVLGGNLPSTQVADLQYHPQDQVLVVATYGRGMYALDVAGVK